MNNFFILEGKNGATYILNAKDSYAIEESLKFYKARTLKQKVMKKSLKLYLNILGIVESIFPFNIFKEKETINKYLSNLTEEKIDFELDENSSLLISPTRDKVIVHHHGKYFHKFAFGDSYAKVKNEAVVYALFDRPLQHFKVSKFYDIKEKKAEYCSFKLSNEEQGDKIEIDLTSALVEMFNISRSEKLSFITYLNNLEQRYIQSKITNKTIDKMFSKLKLNMDSKKVFYLGFVHRDFKPWNINKQFGLLIYDFEEAVTDGLALEDLFNYIIDPIINYLPTSQIVETVFSFRNIEQYKRYLKILQIDIDLLILFKCYLIERVIFYKSSEYCRVQISYLALLEKIENNKDVFYDENFILCKT